MYNRSSIVISIIIFIIIGPYWCAKGNKTISVNNCLLTTNGANANDYVNKAMEAAESGKIDHLGGLVTDWVRLFSATNDTVITTGMYRGTAN